MSAAALLLQILPYLAGRVTLAQFALVAAALGLVGPASVVPDLAQVLQEANGNVCAAARLLGVCPKTIYRRAARAGMTVSSLRTSNGPS
jgi:D-alanyl-D-alanine dipeptidase